MKRACVLLAVLVLAGCGGSAPKEDTAKAAARARYDRFMAAAEQGKALLDAGRYQEAEVAFGRAIEADPTNGGGFFLRGGARFLRMDWAGAASDYSLAIHHEPKNAMYFKARSDAYRFLGRAAEAQADARMASQLDPGLYGSPQP